MAKKKTKSDSPDLILKEIERLGGLVFKSDGLTPEYFLETGIFSLDKILSNNGGIPGNACMEVYGMNGCGKTSLALQIMSEAQKNNIKVYFINSERGINESIVKSFPELDADNVIWIEPDHGEAAIDIMKMILQSNKKCLVVNDSIPACIPSKMGDASASDSHVGEIAKLFAKFMPSAKKYCGMNNNILLQLNQIRSKIGPMSRGGYEQPGGQSVKFYSDIRVELKRRFPKPNIESADAIIGHYIEAKVQKTRWAPPFQTSEIPIIYGKGFDIGRDLVEYACLFNIITKSGPWFKYYSEDSSDEEPIFTAQGVDKMTSYVNENKDVQQDIKNRINDIEV